MMNFKKNPFSLLMIGLFVIAICAFTSCDNNDDDPTNSELLMGTWVNTMVDNQEVLTDLTFAMEFRADNTELYAIGIQVDENNQSWQENVSNTYSISKDMIIIDGIDELGNITHIEFKIKSLDDETLIYTVPIFSINGTMFPDEKTYTCKKVTNDYRGEFTGVWYGRCTTVGNADSLFHYWEYFADGSYNYYYQDENSKWIKKSDNEGHYFLYGQLMANNYSHDILIGGKGMNFECWDLDLSGNNMTWTGLRKNNVIVKYEMEKVVAAPTTGK